MKIYKEDLFLVSIVLPLFISVGLLLSVVKAPSDLFKTEEKKIKTKINRNVKVKETPKEEIIKVDTSKSLSDSLTAPNQLSGDLKSLSAGVVSESSSGSGGMNISQGNTSTSGLIQETGGESRAARALQVTNPDYPQSARARGIEGFVVLDIVVSERGQVGEVRVLSSKPEGVFDLVAIEAVKKWTFEASIENGKAVASHIKQKVNFELD
jgi:TonB family protein